MSKILITGAAGFIGHHVVEHILKNTEHDVVIVDRLTYASSGFDRLKDIGAYNNPRVRIFAHNFTHEMAEGMVREIGPVDYILHLGAETHVDRSIKDPRSFIMSNMVGTFEMLEYARKVKPKKFLYFSTDEVFGDAPRGTSYKEWDRYNSRNPYAASKAGGEELCLAYANTYGLPLVITHSMNCFGERQHPEKFIPIVINKIRRNETLQIHCSNGRPASRSWIHCRNIASAVMFLIENTAENVRDKYNICGEEMDNLDMALVISDVMKKELSYELVDHYSDRPGHDPRYMLDGERIKNFGWEAPKTFMASLRKTVEWSLENPRWLDWS